MRWCSVGDANCSVARTLSVVGERWTMLILREAFLGRRRFDEFRRNTGIARNILATRLRELVRHGVLVRARSRDSTKRVEYRLTEKGLDLYPVLVSLMRWGDRWLAGKQGPPMMLIHRGCGRTTRPAMVCTHCGAALAARETIAVPRARIASARRELRRARA
ncbi:MAG: winged helix-turn-helix transcriptional regulator [Candidatus Binataceae bacterium]